MASLVLLLWMYELLIFSTAQQGCRYTYVKQPVTQLPCNPYERGDIRLMCRADGPTDVIFNFVWFREALGSDAGPEALNYNSLNGRVQVNFELMTPTSNPLPDGTIRRGSLMRLSFLNDKKDIGQYWCQIIVNNSILLQQSNTLNLTNEQSYSGLRECNTTANVDFNMEQTTCAEFPEPPSIPSPSSHPGGSGFQSTADITAATTEDGPSPSSDHAVVLYSVLVIVVVFVAFVITVAVLVAIIAIRYRRRHDHMTFKKTGRENHPSAPVDHEEPSVDHDYMELPSLPRPQRTEDSRTELENRTYDIPVLDHNVTGAHSTTNHEYEGLNIKYDYTDSHLPINKPQNNSYASGHRPEDIPKENKSYARVHRPIKCSAKENKSYARVHRPNIK